MKNGVSHSASSGVAVLDQPQVHRSTAASKAALRAFVSHENGKPRPPSPPKQFVISRSQVPTASTAADCPAVRVHRWVLRWNTSGRQYDGVGPHGRGSGSLLRSGAGRRQADTEAERCRPTAEHAAGAAPKAKI
jgi:hypothetical protein